MPSPVRIQTIVSMPFAENTYVVWPDGSADCVVVDVQCDYTKHELGNMRSGEVEMAALEATLQTIGERIPPKCLTLIETSFGDTLHHLGETSARMQDDAGVFA